MNEVELIALSYPNRGFAQRLVQLWERGAAVLPINPDLPRSQVEDLLRNFRPAALEDEHGITRFLDGVPVGSATALVIPTSGSSGRPKGVELSHTALSWSAAAVNNRLGADGGRWLACLPLSHIAGIGILTRSMAAGTEPVIHDRFDIEAIAAERGTSVISLVPATLLRLIDAGVDLSHYRAVLVGGGPVPMDLIRRAHDLQIPAIRTYGMTETCGGCIYDGFPLEGVEMAVESGQILLKGPMTMDRYRLQPGLTDEVLKDGWLRTSDRGAIDDRGKLEVFGRTDDVIISGGEKIPASVVAEILKSHKLVADAAVVGIDHPEWGQIVAALVVAQEQESPTLEVLKRDLRASLPGHAMPKKLRVVAGLPRTATGKLIRDEVHRLLS